jgi:hypothetical protein
LSTAAKESLDEVQTELDGIKAQQAELKNIQIENYLNMAAQYKALADQSNYMAYTAESEARSVSFSGDLAEASDAYWEKYRFESNASTLRYQAKLYKEKYTYYKELADNLSSSLP